MTGVELIREERLRQITEEGWTAEHDDTHDKGEMVQAAVCYAYAECLQALGLKPENATNRQRWPWAFIWWKPSLDPVRNLVKAGALIAAEIDRLQRKKGGSDAN